MSVEGNKRLRRGDNVGGGVVLTGVVEGLHSHASAAASSPPFDDDDVDDAVDSARTGRTLNTNDWPMGKFFFFTRFDRMSWGISVHVAEEASRYLTLYWALSTLCHSMVMASPSFAMTVGAGSCFDDVGNGDAGDDRRGDESVKGDPAASTATTRNTYTSSLRKFRFLTTFVDTVPMMANSPSPACSSSWYLEAPGMGDQPTVMLSDSRSTTTTSFDDILCEKKAKVIRLEGKDGRPLVKSTWQQMSGRRRENANRAPHEFTQTD